jgi:hypothetical protein
MGPDGEHFDLPLSEAENPLGYDVYLYGRVSKRYWIKCHRYCSEVSQAGYSGFCECPLIVIAGSPPFQECIDAVVLKFLAPNLTIFSGAIFLREAL